MTDRAVDKSRLRAVRRGRASTVLRVPRAEAIPPITIVVGRNVRRMRTQRGLSLERLAQSSGVSRAMLGQLELGKTTPSIHVVWKIAHALGVTLTELVDGIVEARPTVIRASAAKLLTSNGGETTTRALSPVRTEGAAALFEVRLAARSREKVDPHSPGTRENLVVVQGQLGMWISGECHCLTAGDAIEFPADVAHEYRNDGEDLLLIYVVMTRAPGSALPAQGGFPHP